MFIKRFTFLPLPQNSGFVSGRHTETYGSKSDVNFRKKKKSFSSPFLKPNTFHPRNEPACTEKKQNEMTPNK